ncbi:MAG TPA: hypothetical protein VGX48_03305 [Pyrinomonadaceae bacterium]|jgi:hypothetical protein|nr:hypothetical protein [Pyrinomonadaceae bacterium]
MPVIGRLDEQVHDVLISPVSKRRPGGDEPQPPREPAPPEESPRKPLEDESPRRPAELPVWLL